MGSKVVNTIVKVGWAEMLISDSSESTIQKAVQIEIQNMSQSHTNVRCVSQKLLWSNSLQELNFFSEQFYTFS